MTVTTTTSTAREAGNGTKTAFDFSFKVPTGIDVDNELEVFNVVQATNVATEKNFPTDYTATINSGGAGGTINYAVAPPSTDDSLIKRKLIVKQPTDIPSVAPLREVSIENALDRAIMITQQMQEQIDRAVLLGEGSDTTGVTIPEPSAGKALLWDATATTLINSTDNFNDIVTNASASATAAASSASAAATSASNASTSETNAASSAASASASATAAQNAANSLIWNDVTFLTFADSPITLDDTYRGHLLVIDTSGGSVVVNCDAISTLTLPFTFGVKKSSSDGNTITVNRGGTDTIDGATTKVISVSDSGATFLADTDPSPDEWTTTEFGAIAGNMTVNTFVEGTDFTGGTSTTLTLTVDPGNENNVQIYFDGVFQQHNTFSVSGTTVTFGTAIPSGVNEVEAVIGTTVSIGTPSDNTVTTAKIVDNAVTTDKVEDTLVNDFTTVTAMESGDKFVISDSGDSNNNKSIDIDDIGYAGSWTPSLQSTGASFAYTTQLGEYYRIGRLVFCRYRLELNGAPTGTTTNSVFLAGLPFAQKTSPANLFYGFHAGHIYSINLDANEQAGVALQGTTGGTIMEFKGLGDNITEQAIIASQLGAAFEVRGSFTYVAEA